jgi:hypothetical protein
MVKCRISVSFDEENFFWVVVGRDIFIKNPTKEDLMGTKLKYYNETNICPRCKEECEKDRIESTDRNILCPGKAYREKDKDGKETGRWICGDCYRKDRYIRKETNANLINSMRPCRTEDLDPNCSDAKGDDFEELTHRWKEVEILSKKNEKYCGPLDHSADIEGKIPQTKGKWYDPHNQHWVQKFTNEHNAIRKGFKFDYLIFYCASEDGKYIERVYEFPVEEMVHRSGITVYKNILSLRGSWVERYRITDKEELKKVNKIWKEIIMEK